MGGKNGDASDVTFWVCQKQSKGVPVGEKTLVASLASPVVAVVPVVSAAQASEIHTQKGGGQLALAGREGLA